MCEMLEKIDDFINTVEVRPNVTRRSNLVEDDSLDDDQVPLVLNLSNIPGT